MEDESRINSEWVGLNAFRGLTKIATKGDMSKSTYDNALELGGELYPALLGADVSILRIERESDSAKEYRQKARLRSIKDSTNIEPLDLLRPDIEELKELLQFAKLERRGKGKVDQLKRRLHNLLTAEKELNPVPHTENQLIFRDAIAVDRTVPVFGSGRSYRDFELPDENILRVRVLHPDKPEHITGADIIYEKHDRKNESATIVAVQYKIWDRKTLYLSEDRMQNQISRMHDFLCANSLCKVEGPDVSYRFPCCSAFLRPTDKIQKASQAFISTGEHLPICQIKNCMSKGERGGEVLTYAGIKDVSLSSEMFEQLFNKGKIGSRSIPYEELESIYTENEIVNDGSTVVIYAQEFSD